MLSSGELLARDAMAGLNPIMLYGSTYDMHAALDVLGVFENGVMQLPAGYSGRKQTTTFRRYIGESPLRYRVNHGNGYITQHEWRAGQHACKIDDMKGGEYER